MANPPVVVNQVVGQVITPCTTAPVSLSFQSRPSTTKGAVTKPDFGRPGRQAHIDQGRNCTEGTTVVNTITTPVTSCAAVQVKDPVGDKFIPIVQVKLGQVAPRAKRTRRSAPSLGAVAGAVWHNRNAPPPGRQDSDASPPGGQDSEASDARDADFAEVT